MFSLRKMLERVAVFFAATYKHMNIGSMGQEDLHIQWDNAGARNHWGCSKE